MAAEPTTSSATRVNSEIRVKPSRNIVGMKFVLDSEEPGWIECNGERRQKLGEPGMMVNCGARSARLI
ncbi:MAG: hypothetical protein QHD01_20355 [Bradyrhizobium sp.]|uniref:hypothetical protein n=1 Tax=Bradyrhizobium sp. TaxID=376 RepID=UPI0029A54B43|nr:hypothetical protein [Bradyrhizobium sp.]MDX3968929.1 hypothetical protein [Bradyrhizobium sp.]